MKEYTRDITIIVSNTFTNISVKSRLYSLMKWAAFAGFAKNNNNNNNNNNNYNNNNNSKNNNSNNKIMQSTMESITVLHLMFLHFSYQYLEQRQVIRIHIG